jgi:hypothetical protein|tara:strand:- start:381 stop:920 length:540 start_codon:yes stop_codon:yes gene_type:complete
MIKEILLSASLLATGCAGTIDYTSYTPDKNVVKVVADESTYEDFLQYYHDYMDYNFERYVDINMTYPDSQSRKTDLLMLFDNERLLGFESQVDEFWSRVLEASELYITQRPGYFQGFRTDMGKAYVLFGEPTETRNSFDGDINNEVWYYGNLSQIHFELKEFDYEVTKTFPNSLHQYFE